MLKLSSEKDLVKACKKQKRLAQRKVYELYAPKMLSLCRRYVKDDYQAEDVMTNGFLKVFSKIAQFKEEGSFEGWIRRIMVNEALNHLRKQRHLYVEVDISNLADNVDYSFYENTLDVEDLMSYIDQLPVGYKTVFNLYAIEGYSHKEIGEMMNISINTSKSQLSRARKLLQKYILDNDKELKQTNHG